MDDSTLYLCIKAGISVLFVFCALAQMHVGYRTYRAKSELPGADTRVSALGFSFSSNSVGAVIMSLAVLWGFFAWKALPESFEHNIQGIKISHGAGSMNIKANPFFVDAGEIERAGSIEAATAKIKSLIAEHQRLEGHFNLVSINEKPAQIEAQSLELLGGPGSYSLRSIARTADGERITIIYDLDIEGEKAKASPVGAMGVAPPYDSGHDRGTEFFELPRSQ